MYDWLILKNSNYNSNSPFLSRLYFSASVMMKADISFIAFCVSELISLCCKRSKSMPYKALKQVSNSPTESAFDLERNSTI